jgi:hypothetical protein
VNDRRDKQAKIARTKGITVQAEREGRSLSKGQTKRSLGRNMALEVCGVTQGSRCAAKDIWW